MTQTEWIVIGGAPSSGKTTVVHEMFLNDLRIVPEVPRAHAELEMAKGKTLKEIRGQPQIFQCAVVDLQILRERTLDPTERMILDVGLPDMVPYCNMHGVATDLIFNECRKRRYKNVFLFDPLPFVRDHIRTEDSGLAHKIDQEIEEAYRQLGYEPVRVPAMNVEDRIAFVLEHLPDLAPQRDTLANVAS
jgi:predicted ATPase